MSFKSNCSKRGGSAPSIFQRRPSLFFSFSHPHFLLSLSAFVPFLRFSMWFQLHKNCIFFLNLKIQCLLLKGEGKRDRTWKREKSEKSRRKKEVLALTGEKASQLKNPIFFPAEHPAIKKKKKKVEEDNIWFIFYLFSPSLVLVRLSLHCGSHKKGWEAISSKADGVWIGRDPLSVSLFVFPLSPSLLSVTFSLFLLFTF